MEPLFLSLDCGTQSFRSMIFDRFGNLLHKEKHHYAQNYFSPHPGWAEQDPEEYWNSLCLGTHALKHKHRHDFKQIVAVGVTTQRDSLINLDRNGNPLRNIITWLDSRKAKTVYKPRGFEKLGYQLVGMYEAIMKSQIDGKVNWIRQNEPEIWANTRKIAQVSGFLNFRLTGKFIDSVASQIGHIPFEYKKMRWCTPAERNYKVFPIEPDKLMELVLPGARIGVITKEASRATGIPAGIPVIACGSDKGCETLGMGVIDTAHASLSFGTTATIQTTSHRYFEPLTFMPAYPASIPGHYNPEVEIFRGYWMITWFKNEFGYKEVAEAEAKGLVPEILLNRLLEEVPPGSLGLICQPFWKAGLKDPIAKGALIGFGDAHKREHIYRSVVEGLAFALLDGKERIERKGHTRIRQLGVSGGASQSDEICQISADIFNLPLVRGKTYETSGLGAAIISAVGSGVYPDFATAIERMVQYGDTFTPDAQHTAFYRRLYERVYRRMYGRLKPLYHAIREVTGYPEVAE